MNTATSEYEWETTPFREGEDEWFQEGESESEEFFRRLAGLARRAAASPSLRRVGLAAARAALRGLPGVGEAIGGEAGSRGARLGGRMGSVLRDEISDWLPAQELEFEGEWETAPARSTAVMEHLGHAAAEAESEAEAEAFIGALLPIAAQLLPRVAPAVMRAVPQLVRGASQVARTLRRSPATRPLVRVLPTIARRTVADIARRAAAGGPITARDAVRSLARQSAHVLGNPQRCVAAYRRSRTLDREFHRIGPGL